MPNLSQFYPALTVFAGALLVALGGFWASYRQSNFTAEIRAKNEEISRLQHEGTNTITGGDSFLEMGLLETGGGAMPAMFIHHGKYPLYDVTARIVDLDASKPRGTAGYTQYSVNLGNIGPGQALGGKPVTMLSPGGDGSFSYNVFFAARNGGWTQQFRLRKKGSAWVQASLIKGLSDQKVLLRKISDGFPIGPNGELDLPAPTGAPSETPETDK
jgi:hypothetical protein